MTEQKLFAEDIAALKAEIENLDDVGDSDLIEKTARRLEKLNYSPPIVLPLTRFFRLNRESLLEEVDKLLALPDAEACALAPDEPAKCQDLRKQFITVLLFYYKKLLLLRAGDADEWDEIDELYIHD